MGIHSVRKATATPDPVAAGIAQEEGKQEKIVEEVEGRAAWRKNTVHCVPTLLHHRMERSRTVLSGTVESGSRLCVHSILHGWPES